MALYAFDGTWNSEHSAGEYNKNTNVVRFHDAYQGKQQFYTKGVGTKLGWIGKIFGGAFGAGGKERIEEAQSHLFENFSKGDRDIDIIGFSRGAALALDFANTIAKKGIRHPKSGESIEEKPAIRFLGLWDVVASFGIPINILWIPFQRWNFGYRLTLPTSVQHCFHAMALDERRQSFRVTRVDNGYQVWFRGVHSDIGGGNENLGLNAISLRWMYKKAMLVGLPIHPSKVTEADQLAKPDTPISKNLDPVPNAFRKVNPADQIHYTVADKENCNNPPASNPRESREDENNRKEI